MYNIIMLHTLSILLCLYTIKVNLFIWLVNEVDSPYVNTIEFVTQTQKFYVLPFEW